MNLDEELRAPLFWAPTLNILTSSFLTAVLLSCNQSAIFYFIYFLILILSECVCVGGFMCVVHVHVC